LNIFILGNYGEDMTLTDMEKSWLWLSSIDGVGIKTFRKILNFYNGDATDAIKKLRSDLDKFSFGKRTQRSILERYEGSTPNQYADIIKELGITPLTLMTDGYPELLKQIYDPPLVLFCKGDITLLNHEKTIAVVGTRHPTRYGVAACSNICDGLASNGVCIVSGMARGIDTISHKAALDNKAPTIAVLGCGVDVIYPSENQKVYEQIIRTGVVISEYPPGTQPVPGNFPARNRIVSGLSNGVLVVEAAIKSGTLITIEYAQSQGRDVLAVPGNITSEKSITPNILIRDGCAVVTNYKDILSWYAWAEKDTVKNNSPILQQLTLQEQAIINILELGETHFDEILGSLDFSAPQLSSMLVTMEIKGIIERLPGNKYTIKGR
jgi:DNA processing protein